MEGRTHMAICRSDEQAPERNSQAAFPESEYKRCPGVRAAPIGAQLPALWS